MSLRIVTPGRKLERLADDLRGAKENIEVELESAMFSSLLQVQSKAVQPGYAPIQTGNLRRSITWLLRKSQGRFEGAVGSNLVYAAIQEFGGRAGRNGSVVIKGKHYLERAVRESTPAITERFRKLKVLKMR